MGLAVMVLVLRYEGHCSTKKGYVFEEKETSLGKKSIYGMFILSFKKTLKTFKKNIK